jgi:hypothetical protein
VARLVLLWGFVAACGGGGGSPSDTEVNLLGGIEKGPMVLGSSISISELASDGRPSGRVFQTETSDDAGQFDVELSAAGEVSVEATGFYYNELSGTLSDAAIVLRAFDELDSQEHTTYVNVVTHLAYNRVRALVHDGAEWADAVAQAEQELRLALRVGVASLDPGAAVAMSELGGDTDANAYLLAVSAVLLNAAIMEAGVDGPIDATLQELMSQIAVDLAGDGELGPARTSLLIDAQASLDPQDIEAKLAARMAMIGWSAEVPDLERVLDRDQDGVVDRDDNCKLVANADQADSNTDGLGDACSVYKCGDGFHLTGELCFNDLSTAAGADTTFIDVAIADVDGSGTPDVLTIREGGVDGLLVLSNDGTGTLAPPEVVPANYGEQLVAGRLDGDARDDVFILGRAGTGSGTLLGAPFGALSEPLASPSVGSTAVDLPGVSLFDVEDNGSLELLVGSRLFDGDPAGTFAAPARHTFALDGRSTIGRFDADSFVDVAVVGGTPLNLVVYSSGPLHDFATSTSTILFAGTVGPTWDVESGDIDGDGLTDLALWFFEDPSGMSIVALLNNGDGTFTREDLSLPYEVYGLAMGDLDGDGLLDLVACGVKPLPGNGLQLYVFRANPAGGFAAPEELGARGTFGFELADLNADGMMDIITAHGGAVHVYLAGGW